MRHPRHPVLRVVFAIALVALLWRARAPRRPGHRAAVPRPRLHPRAAAARRPLPGRARHRPSPPRRPCAPPPHRAPAHPPAGTTAAAWRTTRRSCARRPRAARLNPGAQHTRRTQVGVRHSSQTRSSHPCSQDRRARHGRGAGRPRYCAGTCHPAADQCPRRGVHGPRRPCPDRSTSSSPTASPPSPTSRSPAGRSR